MKPSNSTAAPSGETMKMDPRICRWFHKEGKCRFGAACYYAHDAPPARYPDSESGKGAQKDVRTSA
eukprot:11816689-Heterocapsa_arctica.AAC.1